MKNNQLVGLANEIDAQGWCRICPFGESPKVTNTRDGQTKTYIQVMDKEGATALANGFNSLWGRFKRAIASVPLYKGHPDLARITPNQASGISGPETPVGSINRLEAREDGLYAQVALFPSGQTLANNGSKFISPFWWTHEFGTRGEITMVHPVELISGGLTDRPNILGGEALANEAEKDSAIQPRDSLHSMVRKFLKARAVDWSPFFTDEEILGKIESLFVGIESEGNAVRSVGKPIANEHAPNDGRIQHLLVAIANERNDYAAALVELAISQGKIDASDRNDWVKRLQGASNFVQERTALANRMTGSASVTSKLEGRKGGCNFGNEEREQLNALCNERMEKDGVDFNAAWDAVIADPKNSGLVYAMRSSSITDRELSHRNLGGY